VFIVELPSPTTSAPIEVTRVGKWLEHVPGLRLDGERPTSRVLVGRLASSWLPDQPVLYVGATTSSVAGRLRAMDATILGDRRPSSAGHWLKTLSVLPTCRVWWAGTDATEEYEDALLAAFAEGVADTERASLSDPSIVLPWANLRAATGERKATGLSDSLLAPEVEAPAPPTSVTVVPDGDADGARGEPPVRAPRTPRASRSRPAGSTAAVTTDAAAVTTDAAAGTAIPKPATGPPVLTPLPGPSSDAMTADGASRLQAELDELTQVRRPQVIARIRTAKEHGDLKENAEYHAAREEQSFLEGRVQAIEMRLRTAVITEAPAAGARVGLGSIVTLEGDDESVTYTIVGADESAPGQGRISAASPVGRALFGRDVGDEVVVRTPAGDTRYRILEIGQATSGA
jgi:transcription elongation factor GreA